MGQRSTDPLACRHLAHDLYGRTSCNPARLQSCQPGRSGTDSSWLPCRQFCPLLLRTVSQFTWTFAVFGWNDDVNMPHSGSAVLFVVGIYGAQAQAKPVYDFACGSYVDLVSLTHLCLDDYFA